VTDPGPSVGEVAPCVANPEGRAPPDRGAVVANSARLRAIRQSTADFSTFYQHYFPRLVRFLKSQAYDKTWVEDVAQDAMMAAHDKWDDLLTYERPDSWLFRVAIRKQRRLEARARDYGSFFEDIDRSEEDLWSAAETDVWVDDHLDLIACLGRMPHRQREVIFLFYLGGFTLAQAAQILGIQEGTAKTHLHRGLRYLRAKYLIQDRP
jgi:RNA polymerase sigma-70 factor, ECF subfamily